MNAEFKTNCDTIKNTKIAGNLSELIGNTPLLSIAGYCKKYDIESEIVAKLEYFNPLGSAKDRVGAALIADAESKGLLNKDTVII